MWVKGKLDVLCVTVWTSRQHWPSMYLELVIQEIVKLIIYVRCLQLMEQGQNQWTKEIPGSVKCNKTHIHMYVMCKTSIRIKMAKYNVMLSSKG